MNKRKETLILIAGFLSIIAIIAIVASVIVFRSLLYLFLILAVFYLFSVCLSFYLLNSKRISNVKLCWIFVVLSLPIFGFFLFVIFGINPLLRFKRNDYLKRQKKYIEFENFEFTKKFLNDETIDCDERHMFSYCFNVQKRPVYENNQIRIVSNQKNLFSESINLIRSAKKFIHLQYYIISDSVWLRTIANELIKKVRQGVVVRFIYDWVGSYKRGSNKILNTLRKEGVLIGEFNPVTVTRYTSKTNFRCHRKCLIVDNLVAMYGGSNIGDEYIRYHRWFNNWEDSNVFVTGEVVNTLNLIFILDWTSYCDIYNNQISKDDLYLNKEKYLSIQKPVLQNLENKAIAQIVETSPGYNEKSIHDLIVSMFSKANKRIWIITPYFIPSDSILSALRTASISGIDVRIIMPGMPDDKNYILTINRYHYDSLIEADIKIYEYQGFIHSKEIIIDDDISVLGTFNLDFRSLFINYESAMIIKDSITNQRYHELFLNLCKQSTRIKQNTFSKKKKRIIKWKMAFINIYHPLL